MASERAEGQGPAHLICSVGMGSYNEVTYVLDGQTWTSRFAPVALARLMGLHGGKASVLVTPAAREKWYGVLAEELAEADLAPVAVDIPEGRTREELLETFHRLVEAVGEGERVVLDVTFALRHLPFIYLAALTYLTVYRRVTIGGIYYGAFDLGDAQTGTPVLDLTALFRLTEWYHAVRSAIESGYLRPLAESFRQDVSQLFQAGQGDTQLSRISRPAETLAAGLALGLPLEVGHAAQLLAQALQALEQRGGARQIGALSVGMLTDRLAQWATPAGAWPKEKLALTDDELRRQLALAQWYAERGDAPKTLLLLREWLVSLLVLRRGDPSRWLEREHREALAGYLGALAQRARHGLATEVERGLVAVWSGVTDRRNPLAHAGMTPQEIGGSPEAADLVGQCERLLRSDLAQVRSPSGAPRLLVTPLGLSPGVVYSAVQLVRPDRVVVITSAEARQRLNEATTRAGAADLPLLVRELNEPLTGFREAPTLIDNELRRALVEAGEVVVNLSGGTTVIQYVAEQVAGAARRLGVRVRRVAVVDRRSADAQRGEPYVLGELVELDEALVEQEEQEDGAAR